MAVTSSAMTVTEDDEIDLYHTGPGTLAGRYMRLFWHPVHRSCDLVAGRAVPIRIMSEDFTLYRGESGELHLVGFRCAHRGTQLSTGWVEGDSIRCRYHGWKYDATGQCVEQPGEDEGFAAKVKIRSYPTKEYLGLIFAYLGEGEPPHFRRYPDLDGPGILESLPVEVWPTNYFFRLDNALDGAHPTFTHRESARRAGGVAGANLTNPISGLEVAETDYGVRNCLSRPWPFCTHFFMPNCNQVRTPAQVEARVEGAQNIFSDRLFWRLPIDDRTTIGFVTGRLPLTGELAEQHEQQRRQTIETGARYSELNDLGNAIRAGTMTIEDMPADFSTYKTFWVEDYVSQTGQGTLEARLDEHLGRMDAGMILLHKIWRRELKALAEGGPLKEWKETGGLSGQSRVGVIDEPEAVRQ